MAVLTRDIRTKPSATWTLDEFLAFEDRQLVKHQLIAGRVYEMAGGTSRHSRIVGNSFGIMFNLLRASPCFLHTNCMLIEIDQFNAVYPDISAVCGEGIYGDERELTLLNPTLVVEVTSPSSINDDRGWKLERYQSLPSLRAALVIDQHRVHADLYTRGDSGWQLQTFSALDESVPLPDLEIELPLAEVYRGVAVA